MREALASLGQCISVHCICVADPAVEGLVYKVTEAGQAGTEQSKVKDCRGTNSDEKVNRPFKDAMPPCCSALHFTTQFFYYINPYNLREGYVKEKLSCEVKR